MCEICDKKCRLFTRNEHAVGLSPRKLKANFNCRKSQIQDNVVRMRNQVQVVYKEMRGDGAKSNLAKWNLIGGIQFRHVKNCLMFM